VSGADLVSVSLFEDGEVITTTNRGSQLGGAILGGALLGGAGAVIGGLSGTTTSKNKVTRVELRIVIDDAKRPMHDIVFMGLSSSGALSELTYPSASKAARHWAAILSVAMKRAERSSTKAADAEQAHTSGTHTVRKV
jgi:hypothetical protein